jgi:hypothetical protein
VEPEAIGGFALLIAVVMLALLLTSLFLPFGGYIPPVIVGVTTVFAIVILGVALVRGK